MMKFGNVSVILGCIMLSCVSMAAARAQTWSSGAQIASNATPFQIAPGDNTVSCHFESNNSYRIMNGNQYNSVQVTFSARLYLYVTSGTNIGFFLDTYNDQQISIAAMSSHGRYQATDSTPVHLSGDSVQSAGLYTIHFDSHLDDKTNTPTVEHTYSGSQGFEVK